MMATQPHQRRPPPGDAAEVFAFPAPTAVAAVGGHRLPAGDAGRAERTGAFSREILGVITTTGTGRVDADAASSVEYLRAGTRPWSASSTPTCPAGSPSRSTGTRRPRRRRPVPPRPPALVAAPGHRAAPGWRPVYDGGATVQFANRPADLERPDAGWRHPRSCTCTTLGPGRERDPGGVLAAAGVDRPAARLRRPGPGRLEPGGHRAPGGLRPDRRLQRRLRPWAQLRRRLRQRLGGRGPSGRLDGGRQCRLQRHLPSE